MIKLNKAKWLGSQEIRLSFSDGSYGVMDFSPILAKKTPMTLPLEDEQYFCRFFLELGALCWPNGLEFSPTSLHEKLDKAGKLVSVDAA
ncbi:DUF2442 domain-containing protein [Endozoicomonas euniceicola]|uniref:DUF2442 domain-containing protein n=1 Tax=Endozoicomonas euniceicola TaxID=1234143 RepID=A0ABY6H2P8_9GAMM|nr:DUF2442 domain-containing protein [Endozoicomonas euniceicola]UYM18526.1 DUF2442 domain-containing protein [Endozoicomonas euniceicola]